MVGAAALASACGGVTTPDGGGNGVQRDVFVVEVRVEPAESDLADLLGWAGGAVPGAEVRLRQEFADGNIGEPITGTTDPDGAAEFSRLTPATYRVAVYRALTSQEIAVVESGRPTLRAFGGGDKARGIREPFQITVQGNRTGGVVFSEISTVDRGPGDGPWFGYLELYNNSDRVQFLDGRLIGRAFQWDWETTEIPCSQASQYSNDPEGIWARLFQRFPGSGAEHPVAPGQTVLIAFEARDHSEHRDWMFDLSDADFEFRGTGDPDNPDVPDLINAGPRVPSQSGIQVLAGFEAPFLAEPVDPATLPRARVLAPASDDIFVRLPAVSVIDIFDQIIADRPFPVTLCARSIHPNFDRLSYVWKRLPNAHLLSQQRRPIGTAPGGWTILLDTGTGEVDFFEHERTPRGLPPLEF